MKINFRKIKGFFFKYKLSIGIIFAAVLIAAAALCFGLNRNEGFQVPELKIAEKPKETRIASPLTGELVDPSVTKKRPLAVVIENHPDARPQSGYPDADIVFETLAEGGITRTLGIFQSKESKEMGPIRSARPYFVEWAATFKAMFAHVGGSADGLSMISKLSVPDLNQFTFGNYFWRSTSRYAPHNVYTTTEKLFAAAKTAGYDANAEPTFLKFKTDLAEAERVAEQNISIDFSGPDFLVKYKYDKAANNYSRSVGGYSHKDNTTGNQLSVKNVIVLFTSIVPSKSSAGEQAVDIKTTGSGTGYVFLDGKATAIKWTKSSQAAMFKITDTLGAEISLNPGQTWFEVVPEGRSVTY